MNDLLRKSILKWSLIIIGINLLPSLGMLLGPSGLVLSAMFGILAIIASIIIYVVAALEYSKKRNHLATPGEIFALIGAVFAISLVASLLWAFIYNKFFFEMPPELAEFDNANMTGAIVAQVGMGVLFSFIAALSGLQIAGQWRTFQKAGKEGWACIIPIYNVIVMCEIGKKPAWWVILLFIPLVNIVFIIMIINGISTAFGKDAGWTVGLIFLPFIFYPMLAWGDAKYIHGEPDVTDHLVE